MLNKSFKASCHISRGPAPPSLPPPTCEQELMLVGIQAALPQHDARREQEGEQQFVLLKQRPEWGTGGRRRGGGKEEEEGVKKELCKGKK